MRLTFDLAHYSKFFSQKLPDLLTTKILINTNWFAAEMKCKTQKFALKNGKCRDIPYDLQWLTFDLTNSLEIFFQKSFLVLLEWGHSYKHDGASIKSVRPIAPEKKGSTW